MPVCRQTCLTIVVKISGYTREIELWCIKPLSWAGTIPGSLLSVNQFVFNTRILEGALRNQDLRSWAMVDDDSFWTQQTSSQQMIKQPTSSSCDARWYRASSFLGLFELHCPSSVTQKHHLNVICPPAFNTVLHINNIPFCPPGYRALIEQGRLNYWREFS